MRSGSSLVISSRLPKAKKLPASRSKCSSRVFTLQCRQSSSRKEAEMVEEVALKERYRVVVNCIIYDPLPDPTRGRKEDTGNRYLVIRRRADSKIYPGLWSVPGGGVEEEDYRDSPQTSLNAWNGILEIALRREIRQEVGIEVGPVEFLSDFLFIRPDRVPVIGMRYAARALSTDVVCNTNESETYTWIRVASLDYLEFIGEIPDEIRHFDEAYAVRMNMRSRYC
jgi:8-oxo-dGTP pyrophosphatase MutT (NUDIX family)